MLPVSMAFSHLSECVQISVICSKEQNHHEVVNWVGALLVGFISEGRPSLGLKMFAQALLLSLGKERRRNVEAFTYIILNNCKQEKHVFAIKYLLV
jgi:hypothetical protein